MRYWITLSIFLILFPFIISEYRRNAKRYNENPCKELQIVRKLNIVSIVCNIAAIVICLVFAILNSF